MPHAPPEPESRPTGSKVCTCGYDLTGLPTDSDAKCPECGLLLATPMMSKAMRRRSRRLGLLALSPPVVCFVLTPLLGIIVYLTQAFFLITIAIIVWIILWLSAIIAAVAWVRLHTMHRTEETRYVISIVVVFACVVGHPLISIGSLWVLYAVFL